MAGFLQGLAQASAGWPAAMRQRAEAQRAEQAREQEAALRRLNLAMQTGDPEAILQATQAPGLERVVGSDDQPLEPQPTELPEPETPPDVLGTGVTATAEAPRTGNPLVRGLMAQAVRQQEAEKRERGAEALQALLERQNLQARTAKTRAQTEEMGKEEEEEDVRWKVNLTTGQMVNPITGEVRDLDKMQEAIRAGADYRHALEMEERQATQDAVDARHEENLDLALKRLASAEEKGLLEFVWKELRNHTMTVETATKLAETIGASRERRGIAGVGDAALAFLGNLDQIPADFSERQTELLESTYYFQHQAKKLLTLLGDPEVQKRVGRLTGMLKNVEAWVTGEASDTPKETLFLKTAADMVDKLLRIRTGAVANESETAMYDRMVTSSVRSVLSNKASLVALIERTQLTRESIYQTEMDEFNLKEVPEQVDVAKEKEELGWGEEADDPFTGRTNEDLKIGD